MADEAPDHLVAFLYYLVRDLVPPRYLNSITATTQHVTHGEVMGYDPGLRDYVDRLARRLVAGSTDSSPDVTTSGGAGTIPPS